jgi:hypothetical protein
MVFASKKKKLVSETKKRQFVFEAEKSIVFKPKMRLLKIY